MYIDERMNYNIIERCCIEPFQALFVEFLQLPKNANIKCEVIYRQHNSQESLPRMMEKLNATRKNIFIIYPSQLKLAKFIPLYKTNDESDPSN